MDSVVAITGASFVATFLWREILIGLPSLGRGIWDTPHQHTVTDYYARVTRTAATRGSLGIAVLITCAALVHQIVLRTGGVWVSAVCLALVLTTPVGSWGFTWRAAAELSLGPQIHDGLRIARRLTRAQSLMAVALGSVVAIQLATSDSSRIPAGLVCAGVGSLAGALWNEVIVDWPVTKAGALVPSYRTGLLGYYTVMTDTGRRPNLAALNSAIAVALAGLGAQFFADEKRLAVTAASLGLLTLFLALGATRTWPAAVKLGTEALDPQEESRIARPLGAYHLSFVVLLLVTAGLQALGIA